MKATCVQWVWILCIFLTLWTTHKFSQKLNYLGCSVATLQMKGRWEYNINVSFPFMYSQKGNCYFQNRIILFCLPVPTLIYLWEISIFPGSVCLFCCREICGPILGIYSINRWHMNVPIGTEAARFPEKEYINIIFVAVNSGAARLSGSRFDSRISRNSSLRYGD